MVEAKASILTVLCALTLFLFVYVPVPWVGLTVVVLAMGAVGARIEAAIRSLHRD